MGFFKPQDSGQNPRVQAGFASKHSGFLPGCEVPSWAAVDVGNLYLRVSVTPSNAPGAGWDLPSIEDRQNPAFGSRILSSFFSREEGKELDILGQG